MGGAVLAIGKALTVAPAAASAATILGLGPWALVALAVGVSVVAGAALLATSNHAKKLYIERSFDVQDFQMQRQAALIGRSVENAVGEQQQAAQTNWGKRFQRDENTAGINWADRVQASQAAGAGQAVPL